uniref:PLAT domain-containing protein n=1 Tax=Nelumbo nucifera TaxID=4432 RepID=A0A822ZS66_NELNU|nr:TPA_asm: hypothetical protein HUJ06_017664 [Nelumbo nucifera]
MKMITSRHFCTLTFLVLFLSAAPGDSSSEEEEEEEECVYTLYVQTGPMIMAGTDAKISVALGNAEGKLVQVPDLEKWGIMERDHYYYQEGSLDVFSGRGPCIDSPLCWLNLTSDGGSQFNSWYCDFVDVTLTGPHKRCSRAFFFVLQWLSTDHPPFRLNAYLDGCNLQQQKVHTPRNGTLVVRNSVIREGSSA